MCPPPIAQPRYEGRIPAFSQRHLHYEGHMLSCKTPSHIDKRYEGSLPRGSSHKRVPLVMKIHAGKTTNPPLAMQLHYEGRIPAPKTGMAGPRDRP